MAKINFIQPCGRVDAVEVRDGLSVMQGGVQHSIAGIDADCGGAAACATCHVYVEPSWLDRLAAPTEMEESMLGFAAECRPNSRLSCQIKVNPGLDGLNVYLPEAQH